MIKIIVPEIKFRDAAKIIKEVIDSGILTKGPKVKQFEEAIAFFVGCKHSFATTSATTALHLALTALGIKRGDEVLVADFTFPATANVVVQAGAKPILVDIDLDTFNINLEDLEKKITKKTKAIMPVDAFGCPVDMKRILRIAKKYKLKIIEDAACALGAEYYKRKCGALADVACFSFHPRKSITTGEGGMIVANSTALAQKIELLRNHGGEVSKSVPYFIFKEAGFNYRMSELQAALGVVQMKRIEQIIAKRREIAAIYNKKLASFDFLQTPKDPSYGKSNFQSYVVLLDRKINRNKVIKRMKERGIETTIGTYALHNQPFFIKSYGYKAGGLPNSFRAFRQALTLPLHNALSSRQIDYIVDSLRGVVENL